MNLIRENTISNVYSVLTSCSWAFGLLHCSRLQLWRDLNVFWSCSFSFCWTHTESKLDTVWRTKALSELFFVQWFSFLPPASPNMKESLCYFRIEVLKMFRCLWITIPVLSTQTIFKFNFWPFILKMVGLPMSYIVIFWICFVL